MTANLGATMLTMSLMASSSCGTGSLLLMMCRNFLAAGLSAVADPLLGACAWAIDYSRVVCRRAGALHTDT